MACRHPTAVTKDQSHAPPTAPWLNSKAWHPGSGTIDLQIGRVWDCSLDQEGTLKVHLERLFYKVKTMGIIEIALDIDEGHALTATGIA